MSDDADFAAEIAAADVERALATISPNIPAGTAGECDECGEIMPRLVGGRCGFCRDGRRPPLSRFESLPVPEVTSMPDNYISVPADNVMKKVITDLAKRDSVPLGQAALALIKQGLERPAPTGAPAAANDAIDLSIVPVERLAAEVARRVSAVSAATDLIDAEKARADAAESELAAFRRQLGQLVQAGAR